jgi:hypothetical protein
MMPLMTEEEISRKIEHCDGDPSKLMLRKEEAISMQIEHCDDNSSRMIMKGRRCDGAPITWMMMMERRLLGSFACTHISRFESKI